MILAISLSAVSLYYYLQMLKQVFVAPAPAAAQAFGSGAVTQQVVLAVVAAAVILLGCVPEWLISRVSDAIKMAKL